MKNLIPSLPQHDVVPFEGKEEMRTQEREEMFIETVRGHEGIDKRLSGS